jgi:predicted SprT family Zn-dependent metalloprotease
MKPPKNPHPNPDSKTQIRKRETRRPVMVIVCAKCRTRGGQLIRRGELYYCRDCADKLSGA